VLRNISSKEGAIVESIEHEYLSSSLFPVPPRIEQEQITESLKKQMSIYASLETNANAGIKFLQECRTALISAAVTCKIDVRDWTPTAHPQQKHPEATHEQTA